MSREIGFRLWDGERYWYNVAPLNNEEALTQELTDDECGWEYNNQYAIRKGIVERDTGLDDKNGERVREGDIVEWVNGLGEKHIFEIIWNECRASFQMVEICQEYPYILQGLSDKMKPYCEIIGNIHENPELLGCENDCY